MIELPFPPSVNSLWRSVRGKNIISEAYRRWKIEAGLEILTQRPTKVRGPFSIHIVLHRPDNRRRDLDNGAKAILDSLTAAGIIEDDSLAQKITLEWAPTVVKHGKAIITLEAL